MPPLNELYAATHVRGDGVSVDFLDAQLDLERFDGLKANNFRDVDIVVIMSSTPSFRQDIKTIREMKELKRDLKCILFGSHATFMSEFCLQEDVIDFIVCGEPEETLRSLVRTIAHGEPTDEILGIGFKTAEGKFRINERPPFIDMNELPIPDRTLLPDGVDYFNPVVKRVPYTTMQTSRGCPGRCIFCTSPAFYGRKFRLRSAEKVLEELREIKRLGYREVFIRDETFTASKKRNWQICEAMIRENIDLAWIANARADMIDKETMLLMKRAGCHMLKFGVETGNSEILANYKKGCTVSDSERAFQMAKEVGMDTHAHMIVGGPGESRQTIQASVDFVKKIDPTTVTFGILTPYPGTDLFNQVARNHPEIMDGSLSNLKSLHVEGFFSESICGMTGQELSRMVVSAYRQIYFRPTYLFKRLMSIRSREQFWIMVIAGFNVFQFAFSGRK